MSNVRYGVRVPAVGIRGARCTRSETSGPWPNWGDFNVPMIDLAKENTSTEQPITNLATTQFVLQLRARS